MIVGSIQQAITSNKVTVCANTQLHNQKSVIAEDTGDENVMAIQCPPPILNAGSVNPSKLKLLRNIANVRFAKYSNKNIKIVEKVKSKCRSKTQLFSPTAALDVSKNFNGLPTPFYECTMKKTYNLSNTT